MYREKLKNRPPPPEDADDAHRHLTSTEYNDQLFARDYVGIVYGRNRRRPGERALIYANSGLKNKTIFLLSTKLTTLFSDMLAKLDSDIKTLFADGTFRTAPSLRRGHMYQILKIHVEYKGHVFPGMMTFIFVFSTLLKTICFTVFKAVMTGKTRSLYDGVYEKLRELLPDAVKPDTIITDYEEALQAGLQAVFPEADVRGCWFHYAQVGRKFYYNTLLKTVFTTSIISECLQTYDASRPESPIQRN